MLLLYQNIFEILDLRIIVMKEIHYQPQHIPYRQSPEV